MRPQWVRYKELELIPETQSEVVTHLPPAQVWLRRVWRSLTCRLLQGYKPGIRQTYDRHGNPCCLIYDPSTGSTVRLRSDEEFWQWYNQRFCGDRAPVSRL